MKKIAVILAGCGHLDGSEIREVIITLLELDKVGAVVEIYAPDEEQSEVINHLDNTAISQKRNILIESARLARGEIFSLDKLVCQRFDALIIPGGFGVAKNLSNIAKQDTQGKILELVKEIIQTFFHQKKPIGAICIAPALVAQSLQDLCQPTLTLGDYNSLLESFGAKQFTCKSDDCVIDTTHKIVSTPAYMNNVQISIIAQGIEKLVYEVIKLC